MSCGRNERASAWKNIIRRGADDEIMDARSASHGIHDSTIAFLRRHGLCNFWIDLRSEIRGLYIWEARLNEALLHYTRHRDTPATSAAMSTPNSAPLPSSFDENQ